MPAGSSERALHPSTRSWSLILDALADAFPDVRVHGGDASAIWSLDGVHLDYLTPPSASRPADRR